MLRSKRQSRRDALAARVASWLGGEVPLANDLDSPQETSEISPAFGRRRYFGMPYDEGAGMNTRGKQDVDSKGEQDGF